MLTRPLGETFKALFGRTSPLVPLSPPRVISSEFAHALPICAIEFQKKLSMSVVIFTAAFCDVAQCVESARQ